MGSWRLGLARGASTGALPSVIAFPAPVLIGLRKRSGTR
jgi:hypothetical protein